jgi:hypothetical protein
MPDFQVFELPEISKLLKVPFAKLKNWTNGRTGLVIEPSVRRAAGTGTRNLYSLDDVLLFALAREFSGAGFAAKAVGKFLEAIRKNRNTLDQFAWITVWRPKPGGDFRIEEGHGRPEGAMLVINVNVRDLVRGVNAKIEAAR